LGFYKYTKFSFQTEDVSMRQLFKNNIPLSESDEGAEEYGIVVFESFTTIPYSG